MKVAIPVDRAKLEKCIQEAEQANTFSGLSALHAAVANAYNQGEENPIQPCVVGLRIEKWGIKTKTQKGKRGRASSNGAAKDIVIKPSPVVKEQMEGRKDRENIIPIETAKPRSIYDMPTRSDVEASQSAQICGCRCINIIAPAGDCPAKLTSTDQESVLVWAEKTIDAGHKKGLHFSPSALRYFVRQFFDLHSDEHQTVCDCLYSVVYARTPEQGRMPIAIIPPQPIAASKPAKPKIDDEELVEVEAQIKLAAVNLDEIEEEEL